MGVSARTVQSCLAVPLCSVGPAPLQGKLGRGLSSHLGGGFGSSTTAAAKSCGGVMGPTGLLMIEVGRMNKERVSEMCIFAGNKNG